MLSLVKKLSFPAWNSVLQVTCHLLQHIATSIINYFQPCREGQKLLLVLGVCCIQIRYKLSVISSELTCMIWLETAGLLQSAAVYGPVKLSHSTTKALTNQPSPFILTLILFWKVFTNRFQFFWSRPDWQEGSRGWAGGVARKMNLFRFGWEQNSWGKTKIYQKMLSPLKKANPSVTRTF